MVRGIGIDLTEISRIRTTYERFGQRFVDKILTDREQAQLPAKFPVPRLAALFAGKEAAVKALGTGFKHGVHARTVEIIHAPSGKPEISFLGKAGDVFRELGATTAHVSLTHSQDTAGAVVVIEG